MNTSVMLRQRFHAWMAMPARQQAFLCGCSVLLNLSPAGLCFERRAAPLAICPTIWVIESGQNPARRLKPRCGSSGTLWRILLQLCPIPHRSQSGFPQSHPSQLSNGTIQRIRLERNHMLRAAVTVDSVVDTREAYWELATLV
jgi:hypothetical protein